MQGFSAKVVRITCMLMLAVPVMLGGALADNEKQAPRLFEQIPAGIKAAPSSVSEGLDKLKRDKMVVGINVVKIDPVVFDSKSIDLNVPMAPAMIAKTAEVTKRAQNDFTWIGKSLEPAGDAIMVVKDGQVTGSIKTGASLYRVWPLGEGQHAVVEIDQSKFPKEHPPSFEKIEPGILPPQYQKGDERSDAQQTITALVAYTPSAQAQIPGSMESLINLAVAETNQSYVNSKIRIALQLIKTHKVNYQESGTFEEDVARFMGTSDGSMDEIHGLRDQHKADVCVLITNNSEYCGYAAAILAKPESAFCVVYHGCATGYYSFAHEIGHLQGARHNVEMDPSTQPFPYGHGFYINPHWRSIMSYSTPCTTCTRIQYWSNPGVQYQGNPMGVAEKQDNARVLNETAPYISGFRQ